MKDDELEEKGFPILLLEIGKTGLRSLGITAAFYTVFSDKFTLELVLIMFLAFLIIGLIIEMYLSLKKHNSIIQKYNQKKEKCEELKKKKKAITKQFEAKSNHVDMIMVDIPLIYNLVYAITLNEDRAARITCFEYFKEGLQKWESNLSK